jgi:dTDP-4-dehydrorhamnose reductase
VKKKILITGGSGLFALNCAILLRNEYEIFLGFHNREVCLAGVNFKKISLENELEFENEINYILPNIIIHAGGMTNVNECEEQSSLAMRINGKIPEIVARVSHKLNITLVFISTDHLFDGNTPLVSENQFKTPLNIYGVSKSLGEDFVIKSNPNALIIRTNFFGWGTEYRTSFSDFVINGLREEKTLTLFEDVYFTPILIETLVKTTMELVKNKINGIINIVGKERVTKYEFGILLAKVFGLNTKFIIPGSIINNKKLVNRPKDMSLSNQKLINLSEIPLPTLEEQMVLLKVQEETGVAFELKNL